MPAPCGHVALPPCPGMGDRTSAACSGGSDTCLPLSQGVKGCHFSAPQIQTPCGQSCLVCSFCRRESHTPSIKFQVLPRAHRPCTTCPPPSCPHLLPLYPSLILLQPHGPTHCSSNMPGTILPQDLGMCYAKHLPCKILSLTLFWSHPNVTGYFLY